MENQEGYFIVAPVEDVNDLANVVPEQYPALCCVCKPGLGAAKVFVKASPEAAWEFKPPVEITTLPQFPPFQFAFSAQTPPYLSKLLAHLGAGATLVRDFSSSGVLTEKLEVRWDAANWHMDRKGWQAELWNEMDIMYDLLRYPEKWGIVGKLAPDDGSI